jgi:hypothetical protein
LRTRAPSEVSHRRRRASLLYDVAGLGRERTCRNRMFLARCAALVGVVLQPSIC